MNFVIPKTGFKKRACMRNFSHDFHKVFSFFVFLLFAFGLLSHALAEEVGSAAGTSVVNDISLTDNAIKIKVQGPIKYTIYKPADPFTVVVEINKASVGQFKDKIVSTIPGITEIIPAQVQTPSPAARFTILLQSPSDVKAEVTDDTLTLSLEKSGEVSQNASKTETKTESGNAGAITDVSFDMDGNTLEFIIKADGKMPEPTVFQLDGTIDLEIPGVSMKAAMPSKIPPQIRDLKFRTERDRLKFIITLADKTNSDVYVLDDEIVIDLMPKDKAAKKEVSEKSTGIQNKVVNGNKVISLDFQDADIVPILRLLGDVGGYNIVVHPDVKGKITMKLMNVPWDQALDVILKTFNLEKVVEGNIIRIGTVKAFQEEKKSVAETRDIFGKAEDAETRVFTMNYADAEKVKDAIDKAKLLSPRGSMSTDVRTRSVIIKDIPSSLDNIQKLVAILDRQTPQVLIEARMVEVNRGFAKSLGVDWGLRAFTSKNANNTVGKAVGSTSSTSVPGGGFIDPNGNVTIVPSLINLPATSGSVINPTGAITFGFLNAAQTLGIDLRISALEDANKAKTISNPKIMTTSNPDLKVDDSGGEIPKGVVIKTGAQIPVTTRNADGTFSTTYKDANLKLIVNPQVAPDGSITLAVKVTKDVPDFTHTDTLGNPTINSNAAATQVLLKDGETIVIGGILRINQTYDNSGVPGISKIPVLGALFKRETNEDTENELLIFITPTIVK